MKIHQVKTRLVNTYVVEYPEKILVMDVAARCHRFVLGFIETTLKRDVNDISLVTCSHDDPDHMGGIKALATLSNAKIALPESSGNPLAKIINNPAGFITRTTTTVNEMFRPRSWAMYVNSERDRAAQAKPKFEGNINNGYKLHGKEHKNIQPDFRLKHDGQLPGFPDWTVIHTPGHTWDSCCYYHAETGSLLSGDTLLGSNKRNSLVTPAIYSSRKQMQQSLRHLRAMDIQTLYPGHGRIFKGENLIPL